MRILILTVSCAIFCCGFSPQQKTARVCVRNACVRAEVVSDPEARARGLMYRRGLEPGTGMLFVFPRPDVYGFWMRNMLFPIDIIWITQKMRVADTSENMQPCDLIGDCDSVKPNREVLYVLEVEAGFVKTHRIKPGDRVTIR